MSDALLGERVYVYRNLHGKCLSIARAGRIVGYRQAVWLRDVEFRVRAGGHARAIAEGRRNVHAFAIGTLVDPPGGDLGTGYSPRYHYREGPYFRCGTRAIAGCGLVHIGMEGMMAFRPDWDGAGCIDGYVRIDR